MGYTKTMLSICVAVCLGVSLCFVFMRYAEPLTHNQTWHGGALVLAEVLYKMFGSLFPGQGHSEGSLAETGRCRPADFVLLSCWPASGNLIAP